MAIDKVRNGKFRNIRTNVIVRIEFLFFIFFSIMMVIIVIGHGIFFYMLNCLKMIWSLWILKTISHVSSRQKKFRFFMKCNLSFFLVFSTSTTTCSEFNSQFTVNWQEFIFSHCSLGERKVRISYSNLNLMLLEFISYLQ